MINYNILTNKLSNCENNNKDNAKIAENYDILILNEFILAIYNELILEDKINQSIINVCNNETKYISKIIILNKIDCALFIKKINEKYSNMENIINLLYNKNLNLNKNIMLIKNKNNIKEINLNNILNKIIEFNILLSNNLANICLDELNNYNNNSIITVYLNNSIL